MKSVVILLSLFLIFQAPAFCETVEAEDVKLPNIFIWVIPEDEEESLTTEKPDKKKKKNKDKSDDVLGEEDILVKPEDEPIVLKSTTLKGYTEFVEGAEEVLYMDDYTKFTLDIRTPQMMADDSNSLFTVKYAPSKRQNTSISKYRAEEYRVSSNSGKYEAVYSGKYGNWHFGTSFDTESTTLGQLENTTSMFTKYDSKYFSLKSSYKKNNMTVSQIQTDNFSVVPELKFNNIFAIQEVLSADITRNRRSGEFVLSINPLGNKDIDRVRFQVGAKTTQDLNSGRTWSQLEFSTKFKL